VTTRPNADEAGESASQGEAERGQRTPWIMVIIALALAAASVLECRSARQRAHAGLDAAAFTSSPHEASPMRRFGDH
jgi:hypothetical protein